MVREDIELLLEDVKIKPKASVNAISGSNYDYVFRQGSYYISKGDMITLLLGGRVYGCGIESVLRFLKKNYIEIYNKVKDV